MNKASIPNEIYSSGAQSCTPKINSVLKEQGSENKSSREMIKFVLILSFLCFRQLEIPVRWSYLHKSRIRIVTVSHQWIHNDSPVGESIWIHDVSCKTSRFHLMETETKVVLCAKGQVNIFLTSVDSF